MKSMNNYSRLLAITLATLCSLAHAELPVCDTDAQLVGNSQWIEVIEDEFEGLPCQVYFTVDLNTAEFPYAFTDRLLDVADDATFRFELDLGDFALAPNDVWAFLTLGFASDVGMNEVDMMIVEDPQSPGAYAIVVGYDGDGGSEFRTISLPPSHSSHEMLIEWRQARGVLSIAVGAGKSVWRSSGSVTVDVLGVPEKLLIGLITPLDNAINGSVVGFRPPRD